MKSRILTLVATLTLTAPTFACDELGKTGFMPENNLRISKWDKATNGMTKERFDSVIDRVEAAYNSVVKSKGGTLQVNRNWDDDTVNAYAQRTGGTWQVSMFGGLARHQLVTDDGFMLVVCHELGHHLGGAPKKGSWSGSWATNEGQADYFGAMKCMRRVLEKEDNVGIVDKMTVDAEAAKKCDLIYGANANENAMCKRISMAGKSLAMLLGELGGNSNVAFTTPDASKVTRTNDNHPAAQCRLDTYFQGILCDKSYQLDVDDKNPITGNCIKKDGYQHGVRPLCWYKPSTQELVSEDAQ